MASVGKAAVCPRLFYRRKEPSHGVSLRSATHTRAVLFLRPHFLSLGGGRPRLRALSCITSRACRFDCAHMRGLRCSGGAFSPTWFGLGFGFGLELGLGVEVG